MKDKYIAIANSIGLNPDKFKSVNETVYTICELNIMSSIVHWYLDSKMIYVECYECFEVLAQKARNLDESSILLGKHMSEYENTANACANVLSIPKEESSSEEEEYYEDKIAILAIRLTRNPKFTDLCSEVESEIINRKGEI
ncbi:hypothetical protein [Paraclostridium bifermentans]|uniref:hypothetical protein n=1 Tax=Paraclostridium bifermentans TaxID=1490 RepID=UPI00374FBC47